MSDNWCWCFRFDPWALLNGLKNKALQLGVTFARAEAVGFETEEDHSFRDPAGRFGGYHKLRRAQVKFALISWFFFN